MENTQWNLSKRWHEIYMKYLQIYLSYIYIMGPVTGSLPAMPQWVGTGLESVRCWERRTGSCLVLALCGILTVYYHLLRLIHFMSLPWITLTEIWVKNDRNMYEVSINMFAFLYLGASNWLSPCSTSMSRYRSGLGPMLIAWDWFLSGIGIMWYIDGLLPCTKANPFHESSMNNI